MPFLLVAALAAGLSAAFPSHGPTLATEDTMYASVPEVLVSAPRVTLAEILDRVARGEARRESLMTDQSFLITLRVVRDAATPGRAPELMSETVMRVYKKKPDKVRTQVLRRYEAKPKKSGASVSVRLRPGMDEEIVNFAFRPEARREFRYRILGRDLLGDHLIYRIGFEPRSLLDPTMPKGTVWIDTNDFVIVRQEVAFDRSPAPPILKSVDRMVIERGNAGGYWVLKRVLLRAQATLPLPKLGRSFDITMRFDEISINSGLADSLFTAGGSASQ
ncbi:MAG: hypothetical protein HZC42_14200 [Candidatus Eisenbacteria bacterium]|nr:hypothetical protein [Candidatus Eisenbacteria bacterium]